MCFCFIIFGLDSGMHWERVCVCWGRGGSVTVFDVHLIQRKDDVFGVFDEFVL